LGTFKIHKFEFLIYGYSTKPVSPSQATRSTSWNKLHTILFNQAFLP